MEEESRPLLQSAIRDIEPHFEEEEEALTSVRPYNKFQTTWRKVKFLDIPLLNSFIYPFCWLGLWTLLIWQNLEGVFYRAPCKACMKKAGMVNHWAISAAEGCPSCALYDELLSDQAPQIDSSAGLFLLKSESWFTKYPLELNIWNVDGFERVKFRILAPKAANKQSLTYPRSFEVSPDSSSENCMEFAHDAVKDCLKHHKRCRKPKASPLPHRILDLRDFNLSSDIKLYQSNGKKAAYIALSHTWGQQHTFMTTRSNLEERLAGIRLQSLPKTFQDAILIARSFKIRYLWIDSLCIIQDDLSDWEEKSPTMGAIYGNAYMTIAAGSALNDQSGFLGERTDLMYHDFEFSSKIGPCTSVIRVQDLTAPSRRDPLSLRAWAFQERLLSRRTLYYHQQELVFECREGVVCECMSCSRVVERYQREESAYWKHLGLDFKPSGFPRVQIPQAATASEAQHFWRTFIVPEYAARRITKDSDRLPALSAVAAAVHSLIGGAYVAGLWQLGMPADLGWTSAHSRASRIGERAITTLPSCYVAPSWCWTSITGPVEYRPVKENETLSYKLSIVDITCAVASANVFGAVAGGSITLRGKVIYGTAELAVEPDKLWPYRVRLLFNTPQQMTLGFEPDVAFLAESELPATNLPSMDGLPQSWLSIGTTLRRARLPALAESGLQGFEDLVNGDSLNDRRPYGKVACLLLYEAFRPGRSEWFFLVLGPSCHVPGAYERLGALTCWVNGDCDWVDIDDVDDQVIRII